MRKLKLYLETSVWNFFFADDAPEKKEVTLQFFEKVENGEFDIYISDIVFLEFARASQQKEEQLLNLIEKYKPKELEINEEVLELAEKYIKETALPKRAIDDSRHAAVATVYEIDALISWNLKHLANLRRMERINGINLKEGYSKRLEIVTPMEVSND
jgi:predicted nucleic acid-binding protein